MDTDLFLVLGLIVAALAVPSILSAFTDGRAPRAGAILVLISGTLLVTALTKHPGGYAIAEIPKVFFHVIGRYIN